MAAETARALPTPVGAYSLVRRAGSLVYTAGIAPLDPESGAVRGEDVATQTGHVIDTLEALLATEGARLADVVKSTVHLASLDDFAQFDAVYRQRFPEPYPVRTTVGSTLRGFLVEIDVVAHVPVTAA